MRLDWDVYFLNMALLASRRATCERLGVGAVLVKDRRVIGTGYNGSVSGETHCIDEGCLVRDGHCIRTVHAEQNAILQCAKFGASTEGATAYVTHLPCLHCTKSLIQAGIKEIYFLSDYRADDYALEILGKANIKLVKVEL